MKIVLVKQRGPNKKKFGNHWHIAKLHVMVQKVERNKILAYLEIFQRFLALVQR